MPVQFDDSLVNWIVSGVLLLSLGTWVYVFLTWTERPILPFELRRAVPWGAAACMLALIFAIKPLLFSSSGEVAGDPATNQPARDIVAFLFNVIVSEVLIVGGFAFFAFALTRATVRDMGLPKNSQETARDIFVGFFACMAAIVPVLLIQAALQLILHNTSSGHELIKMLTENKPTPAAMAMAALTVIVVAPVCEEITFRLLLQGWLESWEFRKVFKPAQASIVDESQVVPVSAQPNVGAELTSPNTEGRALAETELIEQPPVRGIGGLPFGLVPILGSSLLFALAHFGYGPEPIPLFFLAIVLGYVYQRTHRILPSIVTHATFNAFAMFILWRMQLHAK